MLKTEMRNPNTMHIDKMETAEMLAVIQQENLNAVHAVGAVQAEIAAVVDAVTSRMEKGGRLFYVGCGTSGRLGVLDASECPPTVRCVMPLKVRKTVRSLVMQISKNSICAIKTV